MSLVWSIIATFLYAEIFVVLLLVLPVASPQRWQRFFKSRFLAMLGRQSYMYFYLLLGVLVIFLLEAIREMRKYSTKDVSTEAHLNLEMQHSMRLFRAQRNFYISGFAIFLSLVIRRLVTLLSAQAQLLAQSEASMRQAQSATTAARTLMSQQKEAEAGGEPTKAADSGAKTVKAMTWHFPLF
jgi:B-cell receptor-associated protein 31